MTAEPEYLPPVEPAEHSTKRDPRATYEESYVVPDLPFYRPDEPFGTRRAAHVADPGFARQIDVRRLEDAPGFYAFPTLPPRPRLIPHVGHALIFFLIMLIFIFLGQGLTVWGAHTLHLFRGASDDALANDARLSIPTQAIEYLCAFGVSSLFFSALWGQPFLEGIRWNALIAKRRFYWLLLLGIAVGFGVGFGGDLLPMPKNAPIIEDMMNTATGAWLMFLFSFTGAPLMEELAFRGFMMPSIINAFRAMSDRGLLPAAAVNWIGIPFAVLGTSFCFALMHSPQVSHSWGPVLLIGLVSVVLCIVRLRLNSVLAGAVVHGAYNFSLFAGILVNTSGFQHLDKLKG